jgi:hypothetical protein
MLACLGSVGFKDEHLGLGLSSLLGGGGDNGFHGLEGSGSGVSQLLIGIFPIHHCQQLA